MWYYGFIELYMWYYGYYEICVCIYIFICVNNVLEQKKKEKKGQFPVSHTREIDQIFPVSGTAHGKLTKDFP